MRIFFLCFLLILTSCAKSQPNIPQVTHCPEIWIYAPAHLIAEVAAQEDIYCNPNVHTFPTFCSKEAAKKALLFAKQNGSLQKGSWALFRLEGNEDLLAADEEGQYFLVKQARICAWESL